jgi:outer membrane protein assembly factor BamB
MFLILDGDSGLLRLLEATTEGYRELASAQVLSGHDVWAPLALSQGRLVIRDLTRMVCLDLRKGR